MNVLPKSLSLVFGLRSTGRRVEPRLALAAFLDRILSRIVADPFVSCTEPTVSAVIQRALGHMFGVPTVGPSVERNNAPERSIIPRMNFKLPWLADLLRSWRFP
jgi:hypothetical protein